MAHLNLNNENRDAIQKQAALAWHRRCSELELKPGTKSRMVQMEAYLQGAVAVMTSAQIMTFDEAHSVQFLVMVGRGEELLNRWAAL